MFSRRPGGVSSGHYGSGEVSGSRTLKGLWGRPCVWGTRGDRKYQALGGRSRVQNDEDNLNGGSTTQDGVGRNKEGRKRGSVLVREQC